MITFKEFLKKYTKKKGPVLVREGSATALALGEYQVVVEGFTVHFIFEAGSDMAALFEAQHKGQPLVGQYSVQLHKPHIPDGKEHLHVFAKQNQLFAINKDGTAHDRSHGARIPNRVADAIRAAYPDFKLPADGIIEAAPVEIDRRYRQLLLG